MTKPVKNKNAIITSLYGNRILNNENQFHEGIDIAVKGNPAGVPVYATCNGFIGAIIYDAKISCGKAVFIKRFDADYYCLYFHLDSVNADLSQNDFVHEGDFIGIMGNTGHSFGQHLHYGHRKGMQSGTETYDPKEITSLYL